jgi:hypothetical protein
MKNPIAKAATSTKNFVTTHKTAITIVVVSTVTTAVYGAIVNAGNESKTQFLEEKGLVDEYSTWLITTAN